MKVVILHDWLVCFRGGERVLEALCEMFPDAPIYTLLHLKGSTSPVIEAREIHTSFLNKIPNIHHNYRNFLPLMPFAAQSLKIPDDVDLIISSSHCVIKGVKKPKKARHICYIHTPMRYIYDQFDNYFKSASLHVRIAANILKPYLQWWDRRSNKNIDVFLANSGFVKNRIKQFYQIEADVVHPFVDYEDFKTLQQSPPQKENFYLMVTAFAPNKRVDLAIEAFNELGTSYQLKIIGSGSSEETAKLKRKASSNITFLGNLSRAEVIQEMSKAKGFIFPGVEDFGITPLESLAAQTPVLAYKAGGVLETLNEDVACFFSEPSRDSLIKAIREFEKKSFSKQNLVARSECFSRQLFKDKIKQYVS